MSPRSAFPQSLCSKCTDTVYSEFPVFSSYLFPLTGYKFCLTYPNLPDGSRVSAPLMSPLFPLPIPTQHEMISLLNLRGDWSCFHQAARYFWNDRSLGWRGAVSHFSSHAMSTQVPERLSKVIVSIHLGTALLTSPPTQSLADLRSLIKRVREFIPVSFFPFCSVLLVTKSVP